MGVCRAISPWGAHDYCWLAGCYWAVLISVSVAASTLNPFGEARQSVATSGMELCSACNVASQFVWWVCSSCFSADTTNMLRCNCCLLVADWLHVCCSLYLLACLVAGAGVSTKFISFIAIVVVVAEVADVVVVVVCIVVRCHNCYAPTTLSSKTFSPFPMYFSKASSLLLLLFLSWLAGWNFCPFVGLKCVFVFVHMITIYLNFFVICLCLKSDQW